MFKKPVTIPASSEIVRYLVCMFIISNKCSHMLYQTG